MRRADDVEAARLGVEHDVVDTRLEQLGGQLPGRLDDHAGGLLGRDAADLGRLRAERAGAPLHLVRVSLDDAHRLDGQPEPVGDDHRERRLVPLAVRERAGAEDRLALRRDLDGPELGLHERRS